MQHVESISLDCDGDVLLIKARQIGGACHEGYRSCFFRRVTKGSALSSSRSPSSIPAWSMIRTPGPVLKRRLGTAAPTRLLVVADDIMMVVPYGPPRSVGIVQE